MKGQRPINQNLIISVKLFCLMNEYWLLVSGQKYFVVFFIISLFVFNLKDSGLQSIMMEELYKESKNVSWNNSNEKTRISSDLSLQVRNLKGKINWINLGYIVLFFCWSSRLFCLFNELFLIIIRYMYVLKKADLCFRNTVTVSNKGSQMSINKIRYLYLVIVIVKKIFLNQSIKDFLLIEKKRHKIR